MKYFYFACSAVENEKNYAYTLKISQFDNIFNMLNNLKLSYANACFTKKQAEKIVETWNENYKKNGTFLFDKDFSLSNVKKQDKTQKQSILDRFVKNLLKHYPHSYSIKKTILAEYRKVKEETL